MTATPVVGFCLRFQGDAVQQPSGYSLPVQVTMITFSAASSLTVGIEIAVKQILTSLSSTSLQLFQPMGCQICFLLGLRLSAWKTPSAWQDSVILVYSYSCCYRCKYIRFVILRYQCDQGKTLDRWSMEKYCKCMFENKG